MTDPSRPDDPRLLEFARQTGADFEVLLHLIKTLRAEIPRGFDDPRFTPALRERMKAFVTRLPKAP